MKNFTEKAYKTFGVKIYDKVVEASIDTLRYKAPTPTPMQGTPVPISSAPAPR
jgi:hypothetical protein